MREGQPKAELVNLLRNFLKGFVILRLEDVSTNGIPDIAVTGLKRTSWWEVKLANPDFKARGIQTLTMSRLAVVGIAYYVIYDLRQNLRRTRIVHPRDIAQWQDAGDVTDGFDHLWVAGRILQEHAHPKD